MPTSAHTVNDTASGIWRGDVGIAPYIVTALFSLPFLASIAFAAGWQMGYNDGVLARANPYQGGHRNVLQL